MIDGLKLLLSDRLEIDRILKSGILPFIKTFYYNTGEAIEYPLKCLDKGFEFVIQTPNCMLIMGSLHKFHTRVNNTDGNNYTDFGYTQIQCAVKKLSICLGINPKKLHIQNLEFGVNVTTEISPTAILQDVICYKNRMPINPINDNRGFLIEFQVAGYYLKMYDKGKQYRLADNILRIEVKAMANRVVSQLGIKSVADLLIKENLEALQAKFMSLYKHIVFDDAGLELESLNVHDRKVYEPLQNPKEWVKRRKVKKQACICQERRFKGIVSNYGKYGHYEAVKGLIEAKYMQLIES